MDEKVNLSLSFRNSITAVFCWIYDPALSGIEAGVALDVFLTDHKNLSTIRLASNVVYIIFLGSVSPAGRSTW